MNESERFNRKDTIITVVLFALFAGALTYLCVAARSELKTHCIIALVLVCTVIIAAVITFVIMRAQRRRLAQTLYGAVTEADRAIAADLIKRIKQLNYARYEFLTNDPRKFYEFDPKIIKMHLKSIAKGYKVYEGNLSVFFDIADEIEFAPEKNLPVNADFNRYVRGLAELAKRNVCDI